VEPLFVSISYYLSKITNSPLLAIIILKNILVFFILIFFYKITNLLIKNKNLALISVPLLNFSYAFFSMAHNLLRNQLGNLFLLISIYFTLKALKTKKLDAPSILIASVAGGLVFYSHILPNAVLLSSFLGSSFIFFIFYLLIKKILEMEKFVISPKTIILNAVIFFISLSIFLDYISIKLIFVYLVFLLFFAFLFYLTKNARLNKIAILNIFLFFLLSTIVIIFSLKASIIFTFLLSLSTLLILIFTINKTGLKNKKEAQKFSKSAKMVVLIAILAFIIQAPYITEMIKVNAGLGDYEKSASLIKNNLPKEENGNKIKEKEIKYPNQTEESTKNIKNNLLKLQTKINKTKSALVKTSRIIFEVRLPGFSIGFMLLLSVSILFVLWKKTNSPLLIFILIYFVLIHFASKSDLIFGIGTIPYRFSLMLIFPSLLLLLVFFNHLLTQIKTGLGRNFFIFIILFSFVFSNLPIILEAATLKNLQNKKQVSEKELMELYENTNLNCKQKKCVFAVNGNSFENIKEGNGHTYLRNDIFFSSQDANELINFAKMNSIDYFIYDHFRVNEQGNDIGSIVNTNLEIFEKSSNFKKIEEHQSEAFHLSFFKPVEKNEKSETDNFLSKVFKCNENKKCDKDFQNELILFSKNNLDKKWLIDVQHKNNIINVNECLVAKNSEKICLSHKKETEKENFFTNKYITSDLELKNDIEESNFPALITLHLKDGIILTSARGIAVTHKELQKFSVNELIVGGKIEDKKISYSCITRKGFKFIFSSIFLILTMLTLITIKFIFKKEKVLYLKNNRYETIIYAVMFLLLIDILFLNELVLEFYKNLLNI
jgi:hypothetical protein